jgi:hypothetical protein
MHNMNGIALADLVTERWPEIAIIMTSGALPAGVAPRATMLVSLTTLFCVSIDRYPEAV